MPFTKAKDQHYTQGERLAKDQGGGGRGYGIQERNCEHREEGRPNSTDHLKSCHQE